MQNIVNISRKLGAACLSQHQKSIVTLSTRTFKSDLALDKLYPQSKQNIFTPPKPAPSKEAFNGFIPLDQIQVSYDKASGPGGQNVNKVNTKVDLRFHVKSATWISDAVKEKIVESYPGKINREGFLVIKSDVTRFQQLNLADALEKVRTMIREVEKPKKIELSPEKLERIRKRQEGAARERLFQKRMRSETKAGRQVPIV